ncbi:MAG: hypothetical protein LBU24_04310 [Methanocalculaceae archaeon]|nr:hypothetical protein [Methanocalculaceae archaeon]
MVVPCLTCTALGKHEYTMNQVTDLYEYHISCNRGRTVPDPMPKAGFFCAEYESKLAVLPRIRRNNCAIEIRQD